MHVDLWSGLSFSPELQDRCSPSPLPPTNVVPYTTANAGCNVGGRCHQTFGQSVKEGPDILFSLLSTKKNQIVTRDLGKQRKRGSESREGSRAVSPSTAVGDHLHKPEMVGVICIVVEAWKRTGQRRALRLGRLDEV